MAVCFDIEVKHHDAFKYGLARTYETAWDVIANFEFVIVGATAYIADRDSWLSFPRGDISTLCEVVASADKVITFNGKLWDVPVIGQHATTAKVRGKLRRLTEEDAGPLHDDMCQIAIGLGAARGTSRFRLAEWNFGKGRMDQWEVDRQEYKTVLMRDNWATEDAWQACKAWEDAATTYALWSRWRAGKLRTAPVGSGPTASRGNGP